MYRFQINLNFTMNLYVAFNNNNNNNVGPKWVQTELVHAKMACA